jgi:hypothetical protein
MVIVHAYTKPDCFVMMICDPLWSEITELLEDDQIVQYQLDIIARVFKITLALLLKELLNSQKGIFGKVITHMHIIEFQKRGLPHAHIPLIVDPNDKLSTPEFIDTIVSAEIPDPITFPTLHKIIVSSMLHGPCGAQ